MVIDMQCAFSDPQSRWGVEEYAQTRAKIRELLPYFGDRVVFTRFVSPEIADGSWKPYYEKWPEFAHEHARLSSGGGASVWDLDMGEVRAEHILDAATFSKWVPEKLPQDLLDGQRVTLTGVAYDCCVLGTALAAIEDGMHVRVVTDAVAASSPELADATTRLLEARAPQLELVRTHTIRTENYQSHTMK